MIFTTNLESFQKKSYYESLKNLEKAKAYLLKAVSMTKRTPEILQIKKLLQNTME